MNQIEALKGVYVALYSAYNDQGEVDSERVKALAAYYLDSGITGLYVGGSSGEGILQNVVERKLVLEAVMSAVAGKLKIIVHIGANSTKEAVELAKHAEELGADAVSAVPAIYYRLSEKAVERHWQEMIDSTSLPFIIYNIPQLTGFHLSPSLCAKLARQDKVIGVKMSGESTFELEQLKMAGGESFIVFNGPDEQYLAGRIMGADGGIGGTYGIMPQLFCKLDELFSLGEIKQAQELQHKINSIIKRLISYPSLYGACKYILKLRGIDTGAPRLPLLPVEEFDYSSLEALNTEVLQLIEKVRGDAYVS